MDLITYETIREVERAERGEELQRLPSGFFEAVNDWMEMKKSKKDASSFIEVENAKKSMDRIIMSRMKKIVLSALMTTMKTKLPPSNLADSERAFFDDIVNVLKKYRNDMHEKMFGLEELVEERIESVKRSLDDMKTKKLKMLADVSKFVGSDMNTYGPLKKGDETILPEDVAKVLISRKVADEL